MIYFGEKLRELRIEKGLTQQQLADKLGLGNGAVSAYEQGTKYPSLSVLREICRIFQVSSDYLLGLSDNMAVKNVELTDEQIKLIRGLTKEFERANVYLN